jgi:hypothetical protein
MAALIVTVLDMVDGEVTKISYRGAEYAKTDDRAREGDIGLRVKDGPGDIVSVGKYYSITRTVGEHADQVWYEDNTGDEVYTGRKDAFVIFRKVAESFKVGDYVVSLPEADESYYVTNTRMKLGKVLNTVRDDNLLGIEVVAHDDAGYVGEDYYVNAKNFRKATEEEINAVLNPPLKVGDYVKVVGSTRFGDISEGTIVKITCDADSDGEHRIDLPNGSDYDYAKPEALEKASAEDFAKKKETAKWAEIGRKPGEYKEGDIVRVIGEGSHIKGTIGVVVVADGTKIPKVEAIYEGELTDLWSLVELVTPVERRFDRN